MKKISRRSFLAASGLLAAAAALTACGGGNVPAASGVPLMKEITFMALW